MSIQTDRIAGVIQRNLASVRARMEAASLRAGRLPDDTKLVVVTKGVSTEVFPILQTLGILDVGENRVQEAVKKFQTHCGNFVWHMVGHLQRNKARHAVKIFSLIHSLDSLELACELEKQAAKNNMAVNALIQVNVSGESQKHGIRPEALSPLLKEVAILKNVRIKGLMTMAPFTNDGEASRVFFRNLRELRDEAARMGLEHAEMRELSMGMTQDFEVAIEEGATLVRIGSAIFQGIEKLTGIQCNAEP